MQEYRVFNPNHGPCSLLIFKPLVKEDGMTVHNYKRQLRSASIPVMIRSKESKDLVKETGLSIDELKNQKDLHHLLKVRKLILLGQEQDKPVAPVAVVEVPEVVQEVIEQVVEQEEVAQEVASEVVEEPTEEVPEEVEQGEPTKAIKHVGRPKKKH